MPKRSKGVRAYYRKPKGNDPGGWIIRDGSKSVRTGLALEQRDEIDQRVAAYITEKYRPERARGRSVSKIPITDVLNIYLKDKKEDLETREKEMLAKGLPAEELLARDRRGLTELAQRIKRLATFFGCKMLDDINGELSRAYVTKRGTRSGAGRELQDLRAAVRYHHREGLSDTVVAVWVPKKEEPRQRWLTHQEAARLVKAAWRYRGLYKGRPTQRRIRRHVARFIIVGLYTGTRAGALCSASCHRDWGRGFVDLERGTFERQPRGARVTKKRQPTIRLHPSLLAHIRRWHRLGLCNKAVVEFNGMPIKRITKVFARVVADAGLGPDVTPHTLRHTAATWAMQAGADLWETSGYLGMSPEMLMRVYGHHRPEHGGERCQGHQGEG